MTNTNGITGTHGFPLRDNKLKLYYALLPEFVEDYWVDHAKTPERDGTGIYATHIILDLDERWKRDLVRKMGWLGIGLDDFLSCVAFLDDDYALGVPATITANRKYDRVLEPWQAWSELISMGKRIGKLPRDFERSLLGLSTSWENLSASSSILASYFSRP